MTAFSSGALWTALSVVIGFITDKLGIKLFRGAHACTNGNSITLPRLPEGMLSYREFLKVVGYLYHECAHILKSNFKLKADSPLHKAVCGVLEDVRIENWAQSYFPAARKYLSAMVAVMTEDGMAKAGFGFGAVSEEDSEAEVLQWYMLYRLRHDLLDQVAIKPAMDTAIAAAEKKFPHGMMVRLNAMMFEVANCDSEDEVFELSREIIKMIHEEKEKESDKEQDQTPPQEPGQPDQQPGQQPSGGQGQSGQQQSDDQGQQPSASQASPSGSDDSDSSNTQQGGKGAGGSASLDELLNMGDDQLIQSVGDMLGDELNDIAAQKVGQGATMPNVHKVHLTEVPVDMAKIKAAINATRTKTLAWMSSAAQSDLRRDRKGIMIDASQLAMAAVGGEIFAEECEGIDINAAIEIVLDRSPSMDDILVDAANAALATALAYDVPGIETEVSVFPVYGRVNGASDEGVGVVKRWGEKPRALASRLGSIGTAGSTPMAEAVMYGASSVLRREETLKLVIVVTDGDPNDKTSTIQAIEAARKAGVVVTGLGIGVDTSQVFGEKYSGRLDNINELSGVMTRLVKAAMAC